MMRSIVFLYTILAIALLSATAVANTTPLDYYLQGIELLNSYEGDQAILSEAEDLFNLALEADDKFALAYVGLGWVIYQSAYINDDRYDNDILINKALPLAEKALRLDPDIAAGYRLRANILTTLGRLSKAERDAKKSVELEPDDARSHQVLSYVYEKQGRINLFKSEREKAMQLQKSETEKWRDYQRLGIHYANQENYDLAEEYLQKVVDLKPNSARAYGNYSWMLLQRGDLDKAEEMAKKAIGIEGYAAAYSYLAEIHYNRGIIYYNQGMLEEAEDEFWLSIDILPGRNPAYYYVARMLLADGYCDEVIEIANHLLAVNPGDRLAREFIAACN